MQSRCTSRCWLLSVLTVLLIMQHAAVEAHPITIPSNPNLGRPIDIPSDVTIQPQEDKNGRMNDKTRDSTYGRSDYNHDVIFGKRAVLRRSEQTMESYAKFIEYNCRDIDNLDTFLSWELQQFSQHLKTNIRSLLEDDYQKETEQKRNIRALLAPESYFTEELKSLCKPSVMVDYDEEERARNEMLENEIVNAVFANLYKFGHMKLEPVQSLVIQRQRKRDDEDLDKEIARLLRR